MCRLPVLIRSRISEAKNNKKLQIEAITISFEIHSPVIKVHKYPIHVNSASHFIFTGIIKRMYNIKSGYNHAKAKKTDPCKKRFVATASGIKNAAATVARYPINK